MQAKRLLLASLVAGLWGAFAAGTGPDGGFQAGLARARITPPLPFRLTGYAARDQPATGLLQDLWAKALALEDAEGHRLVVVTVDLLGLPRGITDQAARMLEVRCGLPRQAVMFNASHTHGGPFVHAHLGRHLAGLSTAEQAAVTSYCRRLTGQLVEVASEALDALRPARLRVGHGRADFAVNRRLPTQAGIRMRPNADGPVDHDVPVIEVSGPDGQLRAVVFGYACHNTTLGGDFNRVNGDYAGYAQLELERRHPGATALFLMLCGADQNPHPRGTVELARRHGRTLAEAVDQVLRRSRLTPLAGPFRTAFRESVLPFAPHTRAQFEAEARHSKVFRQRRARLMLEAYDAGRPVRHLSCPVQALRLGNGLTILGLGDEVVVDYALRVKAARPGQDLIVAGYCNDLASYVPSLRVLREGGYEADQSMINYGQPGPFDASVEDALMRTVQAVLGDIGLGSPR